MERYALITGGAIRVGRAICERLAAEGYSIIAIYNNSSEDAKNLQDSLKLQNVKCDIYQCDISDIKSARLTFEKIFLDNKNISLLVNNSSNFERLRFEETSENIFDKTFDINFKAPFFITQQYHKYCQDNSIKGHVVNILDSYISTNTGAYFAYLLSKKSLFELTMMCAKNLAPDIRVNAVSIGLLLESESFSDEQINKKSAQLPLGTRIKLDDITSAICYLDSAKNVTGQNIFVDSGHHL